MSKTEEKNEIPRKIKARNKTDKTGHNCNPSHTKRNGGQPVIFYDGREWRDPEELIEMAGRESDEKLDEVHALLASEGHLL